MVIVHNRASNKLLRETTRLVSLTDRLLGLRAKVQYCGLTNIALDEGQNVAEYWLPRDPKRRPVENSK